ncbi:hypothetical protein ACLOJK_004648, partial [Asimina triloba]
IGRQDPEGHFVNERKRVGKNRTPVAVNRNPDPYRIRRQDPEGSSIIERKSCTGEQDSCWKQQESCRAARNAVGRQERCRALTGFGQDWQQESCLARGVVYTGQTCDRHAIRNAVLGAFEAILHKISQLFNTQMSQHLTPIHSWGIVVN